jgi:SulP family sulfate permease
MSSGPGKYSRRGFSWRALLFYLRETVQLRAFPIRESLRGYNQETFRSDARAGINVALLAFPQGMAYAMLAGLPIQYGVYCAAVACLIGALFCSSRHTVIGPTNATAVMLLSVFTTMPAGVDRVAATSLLVVMVGLFLVLGAFLQLSSLLKFISRSVIIGYITGAALLIIGNQLKHVLGVKISDATTLLDVLGKTLLNITQTNPAALALALATFATLLVLSKKFPRIPDAAVALVFVTLIGLAMTAAGAHFPHIDGMQFGTWPVTVPPMDYQLFFLLVGPAVAIAFLGAMETTVMAKTIASRTGQPVNSNQELLGLGMANIGSGFLSGMPASGSLTRSALNYQSGAATPVSALISGGLCVVGALILGPFTSYIPKAALAAVVVYVAISLIDFKRIRVALKSTKSDATVLIVTFGAALVTPLDLAIFLGVATSIALFLKKASSPSLIEYTFNEEGNLAELESDKRSNPHISIIHVEGELFFGAADLFRDEIRRVCSDPNLRAVVLRMRNARHLDATSVLALEELILFLRNSGRHLLISGATKDVYRILRDTGVLETLGRDNFFLGSVRNPNLATRNALKRAQELLGDEKAEVKIYFDPAFSKKKGG